MDEESITVKNLNKTFFIKNHLTQKNEKLEVLKDISFSVKTGEIVGILGRNGAGKTTLLRIISGVYKPDSGTVKTKGVLAPLLQVGTGFQDELEPKDNIIIYGLLLGIKKNLIKSKVNKILKFAELEKFENVKLKHFSSGMRARLGFSTALELKPDILLVDEILSVGDLAFSKKSYNEFLKFKKNNKTILFTSHNLNAIADLSDRVLLLENGSIIASGPPEQVIPIYEELIKKIPL